MKLNSFKTVKFQAISFDSYVSQNYFWKSKYGLFFVCCASFEWSFSCNFSRSYNVQKKKNQETPLAKRYVSQFEVPSLLLGLKHYFTFVVSCHGHVRQFDHELKFIHTRNELAQHDVRINLM